MNEHRAVSRVASRHFFGLITPEDSLQGNA